VIVNTLDFKKFSQYPGRDVTSIDIQMTYNTQNPLFQLQRSLTSAIARVSAATFDSDVLPGGAYNYSLGQAGTPWLKVITADGGADAPSYTFGNDTDLGVFRAGTDILGFSTAGSERMRIDASGNVGVGTTTPTTTLMVYGTTTIMNGNVGVGTTEPQATLDIQGTTAVPQIQIIGDSGHGGSITSYYQSGEIEIGANIKRPGGTYQQIKTAMSSWIVRPSPYYDKFTVERSPAGTTTLSTLFTINSSGNVGIGTTDPGQKLTVAGIIESTSGGFKFPDGTTQATAATGAGTDIAILTGTVAHGGTIPLPDGYTQDQCKWFVSINYHLHTSDRHEDAMRGIQCSADANRVVTCRCYHYETGWHNATANYMIIGTK